MMARRKKSRSKKSNQSQQSAPENALNDIPPRSFILRRNRVGRSAAQLVRDMRAVLAPNTAHRLQESRRNTLKDFVRVAPTFGVTHMIMFTQNGTTGVKMRLARLPHGPTLTFRVRKYSLARDVIKAHKKPHSPGVEFKHAPLVVLNGFNTKTDEKEQAHVRIAAAMFQNLFPPIDVKKTKLVDCRRVVLMHRDTSTGVMEMRHYLVTASPVGLTKAVKKISIKSNVPNLGKLEDISDLIFNPPNTSDSEAEDAPDSSVILPQQFVGKGNKVAQKSAIRLKELGPRLQLDLLKVEDELCTGKVIYHSYVEKSQQEIQLQDEEQRIKKEERARRKAEQAANVERKVEAAAMKKRKRVDKKDDDYTSDTKNLSATAV